ncbi:MAG TPA: type II toxin-antitoxin system VapC family toxin [Candidatus Acidoferrales bacterium]|nr:type II toxin-antitoxin system VapC family toxin [Candidatus Acidoferrales bacterium]
MRAKVYIETTVVSYLTARPSRDVVIAGHQQTTHEWWETSRDKFDVVASQLVVREAGAGDSQAAQERLAVLSTLTLLEVTEEALALAQEIIRAEAVPEKADEDALHVAIAVTNGVEYLLTWNCKHLANATLRAKIEEVCRSAGYEPVIICTPEELLEV